MDDIKRNNLIIEEMKKRRGKEAPVDVETENLKLVIFTLRDGLYAFPGADVKEILPFMEIFPVPGAPDFIPGVINNRGDIESVINLNRFLGLPDSDRTAASRIAMASSKAGVRSGILVDAVLDVVDLPLNAIKPPLSTLDYAIKDLVTGELIYHDRTVVMLDVGRLFNKLAIDDE
ncbi:MAG: purine-binding chemotaxis protein CheW [Nitrospirae bacterium]|nr:purine-binding chemotaxis protein CheW [Nitrospirota bacterium]